MENIRALLASGSDANIRNNDNEMPEDLVENPKVRNFLNREGHMQSRLPYLSLHDTPENNHITKYLMTAMLSEL
jgi:hypothetical protein